MRMQFSKLALAATFGLAMAFTFTACMTHLAGLTETQAQKERREESSREHQRKYKATYDSLRAIYDRDTVVMMTIGDKAYKTVMIGQTVWMAENLNREIGNSVCYENKEENCDRCGRLYDYETAMRKACPSGWRLGGPSEVSWDTPFSRSTKKATGAELRAKSGWDNNSNGEDKYGFSALPCGAYYVISTTGQQAAYAREKSGGGNDAVINMLTAAQKPRFSGYGSSASFWYSAHPTMNKAYYSELNSNRLERKDGDIASMFSVRCVLDAYNYNSK